MVFFKKFIGGNTLFYPGCLTKFVGKDIDAKYRKILNKIGTEFIVLTELEQCCGSPIINAGHLQEAKELADNNFKIFKEHSVRKIITACPACYKMFTKDYPEMIPEWDIETEHMTITINRAIKAGKYKPKARDIKATYHDPCHLGRHCHIYNEPREIIQATGAELKEMKLTKEYAFCCGAGSGVKSNYPELANASSKERTEMAKETDAKCLLTSCPMCYYNLKENAEGIKVKELSQFLEDEDD